MGYWEIVNVADSMVTVGFIYDDSTLTITDAQYTNTTPLPAYVTINNRSFTVPANANGTISIPPGQARKITRAISPINTIGNCLLIPITARWP